jgi:hypothetical protein
VLRRTVIPFVFFLVLCTVPFNAPGVSRIKSAVAFTNLEYLEADADYQFGQSLSFKLLVESEQAITDGTVTFKEIRGNTTGLVPVNVIAQENGLYLLSAAIDLATFPLRVFSEVQYRFDASLDDGSTIKSPDYFFSYLDNRFDWQSLENGLFRVYWQGNDPILGEKVMETAQNGLERITSMLNVSNAATIDIYIYNQADDLKLILPDNKPNWSLGYADPELNHVLIALPAGPDQDFLIQRHVPHEIMHIMVARLAGDGSGNLPGWLGEGLASLAELWPNPDYAAVIENAHKHNRLISLQSLCRNLPVDSSNAVLASAQSASFVRFIYDRYETKGIQDLIHAYAAGADCSEGLLTAFGEPLHQLEGLWLSNTLGKSPIEVATNDLTPWFVLLISILIAPLMALIISLRRKTTRI